jgi:hypothetical protein
VLTKPDHPGTALRQPTAEVGHFGGIAGRYEKYVDDDCLLVNCCKHTTRIEDGNNSHHHIEHFAESRTIGKPIIYT